LRATLACVRPFGVVASFGQSSGSIPVLDLQELGPRRSLMLARPSVMLYMAEPATYRRAAAEVLEAAAAGVVSATGPSYPLRDAARAHRDLESGATTGAPVLVPG
jgi:NADPH:quinone reductase